MAQSNESEAFPNDIIGKLFGAEHSVRVWCLGVGTVLSNAFKNAKQRLSNLSVPSSDHDASSSTNTYLHRKVSRLKYQLEGTLSALKAYLISKEGSIPDEFLSLFAPQPQVRNKYTFFVKRIIYISYVTIILIFVSICHYLFISLRFPSRDFCFPLKSMNPKISNVKLLFYPLKLTIIIYLFTL